MGIVTRFLSFDALMGPALVKIVYFLGLIAIALSVLGGVLSGLGTMFGVNFGMGLGMIIGAPIFGLFAVCFLRFGCELYIVLFRVGEDIAAIRARGGMTPPPPPPPGV